jgi:hypothetical protein
MPVRKVAAARRACSTSPVPSESPASAPPPEPGESTPATTAPATETRSGHPSPGEHGHHGPVHTHCENCGTALQGPFCHRCGQHDFDVHRSFGHTALEALENFFHFDAKFFRNIVTLLFRPGVLTAEFNAGKRVAQMPPFRLYLFVSVLFFFISFVGRAPESALEARARVDERSKEIQQEIAKQLDAASRLGGDSQNSRLHEIAEEMRQAPAVPKTLQPAKTGPDVEVMPGVKVGLLEDVQNPIGRLLTEKGRHALEDPRHFREAFLHGLPKMLLVCLPLFALYTRFLFRRSGQQFYLQHLILALHFHTFIFLFLLTRNGWIGLADFVHAGGFVRFAANLWLAAYPALMLRHLFRESWPRTIAKTLALTLAYGLTLLLGFLVTVFAIFLLL